MKTVNLDITHRCTLECPKCRREKYRLLNQKVPGKDMSIDEYRKIIEYFDNVVFCGNISDPVFNPNFIKFLELNYEHNIDCEIHHAATGKPLTWYEKAYKANPKAGWVFGIDGFPEESHLYRKNQNGPALFEAMKLCKKLGLRTTWRYIIFKYNEYSIKECKMLADHYDINIQFVRSSRFDLDDPLKPENLNNYKERPYEED